MKNTTIAMAAVLFLSPVINAADINFDNNKFDIKGFVAASKLNANSNLPKATLVEAPAAQKEIASSKFNPGTRTGRISGSFNNAPVSLTFSRTMWTLTGSVNNKPVNLQLDMDALTINGFANDNSVSLRFKWDNDVTTVNGFANSGSFSLDANWNSGALYGYTADGGINGSFNLKDAGYINAYSGKDSVNLNYNPVSGGMTGTIGDKRVNLTMSNMNDADIMTFFFLFLK